MGFNKTIKKITVILAFTFVFISSFALIRGYSDTVSAPFIGVFELSRYSENAGSPEDAGSPALFASPGATPPPPVAPVTDDFVTIRLTGSDIYRGSLLLINQDHGYEISDDNDLARVSEIMSSSYMIADDSVMLDISAIGALNVMMDAYYEETGRDNVAINSGFRDYAKQQEILDDYIRITNPVEALKWAAPPGYSEHHSGLAFDFGIFNGETVRTFTGAGLNEWFRSNSWRYGFILRYEDEKTSITGTYGEPWHFRFTGLPHSYIINKNDWCFEEYIGFITGYAYEEPYQAEYNGVLYEIYYTNETRLRIPFDCDFDYSGNNIDGFIVTIIRGL